MFQLKKLTKAYQNKNVLSKVDFNFPTKGLVCLMGESGTGKSTLLYILAGLDRTYKGEVLFAGQNLGQLSQAESSNYRKDYLGLIFQDYHLLEGYTALENVLYPRYLQAEADQVSLVAKGEALLTKVGLAEQRNQKIEKLSGGQKQRVAIARALLNNPQVLLADEPTGALDRETATGIMHLLQKIAEERLVVLITHDPLISDYGEQVLIIDEQKLLLEKGTELSQQKSQETFKRKPYEKIATKALGWKNFKVNWRNYGLIAVIFAISATCLLFTFSAQQVIEESIAGFQKKNSALSNGFIKDQGGDSQVAYQQLVKDQRVAEVYKQYLLTDLQLKTEGKEIILAEKYPLPRAKEVMSYGIMPRKGQNEVALSGTLAKQFAREINQLIGKNLTVTVNQKTFNLRVSGIYNAGYDDLYLSSDVEQASYQDLADTAWQGISFEVKDFSEIEPVYQSLEKAGFSPEMALEQVKAMLQSFTKIKNIFLIITVLVLAVCLFIIVILLMKLQVTRQKLVGLLGALGFNQKSISRLLAWENSFLGSLATLLTAFFSVSLSLLGQALGWPISLTSSQLLILLGGTFSSMILISFGLQQKSLGVSIIESLK